MLDKAKQFRKHNKTADITKDDIELALEGESGEVAIKGVAIARGKTRCTTNDYVYVARTLKEYMRRTSAMA